MRKGRLDLADQQILEDAAMKLKIRENQMILDQLENNVDQNYLDFASTLSLFDVFENQSYERSIIGEIEILDQKDPLNDPLANQKLVNEHVFYKQVQSKMKSCIKELENENQKLSAQLKEKFDK